MKKQERPATPILERIGSEPASGGKSSSPPLLGASTGSGLEGGTEKLSDLSCKLMNKLNEEESKLRQKSNLEIGTWSNEMAQNEAKKKNKKNRAAPDTISDGMEEDFEELLDPNIALPDNLTFLDETILPQVDPEGEFVSIYLSVITLKLCRYACIQRSPK